MNSQKIEATPFVVRDIVETSIAVIGWVQGAMQCGDVKKSFRLLPSKSELSDGSYIAGIIAEVDHTDAISADPPGKKDATGTRQMAVFGYRCASHEVESHADSVNKAIDELYNFFAGSESRVH